MKYFWMSFYCTSEDYRPLTFPPNEAILGWWCTGQRADNAHTICLMVRAESEQAAKEAIAKDWPELKNSEWRFVHEQGGLITPEIWNRGGRFQLSDWMLERWSAARMEVFKS